MDCRCPVLTLTAAVLLAAPHARAADEATAGSRLRVTSAAAPSGRVTGTLVGLDDAALTLRLSGKRGDLRLPRDSVSRIEISRRRGNRGKGALVGFLAGAALGAVVGAASADTGDLFSPGEAAGAVAVIFAPAGALLSTVFSHSEEWEPTSYDGLRVKDGLRLGISIAPDRGGGAGLQVSLGF